MMVLTSSYAIILVIMWYLESSDVGESDGAQMFVASPRKYWTRTSWANE